MLNSKWQATISIMVYLYCILYKCWTIFVFIEHVKSRDINCWKCSAMGNWNDMVKYPKEKTMNTSYYDEYNEIGKRIKIDINIKCGKHMFNCQFLVRLLYNCMFIVIFSAIVHERIEQSKKYEKKVYFTAYIDLYSDCKLVLHFNYLTYCNKLQCTLTYSCRRKRKFMKYCCFMSIYLLLFY